jgi:hypothetical protein
MSSPSFPSAAWGNAPPPFQFPPGSERPHYQAYPPNPVGEYDQPKRCHDSASEKEIQAGQALADMNKRSTSPVRKRKTDTDGKKAKKAAVAKDKEAKVAVKKEKDVGEGPKPKQGVESKKSCSECRRLKAKCDRVFPCSNCEYPRRAVDEIDYSQQDDER